MDTATLIAGFKKFVGEVLADLKHRGLGTIDAELLRLKRESLSDGLKKLKDGLADSVKKQKEKAQQTHIARGLSNTTVLLSTFAAIDSRAAHQMVEATREYNRAIEEIALLEKRVALRSRPWWKRLWPL